MKKYWEMTKKEFYAPVEIPEGWGDKGYKGVWTADGLTNIITPEGERLVALDSWGIQWGRSNNPMYHRYLVLDAMQRGEEIPQEVLEEYDFVSIPRIKKEDLEIPKSLDDLYISLGYFDDYWRELPINWATLDDNTLKAYPILHPILDWKKSLKKVKKSKVDRF